MYKELIPWSSKSDNLVFWLTGLSGSGKSSISYGAAYQLQKNGVPVIVLDGDCLRKGLSSDLSFTQRDREEHNRRASEVAKLLLNYGCVICALISPTLSIRRNIRNILGDKLRFIYVKCDIEICAQRDPKGLYDKAQKKLITNFTGIDDNFDPPNKYNLLIDTSNKTLIESINELKSYIYTQIKV